jgi:hypothetical protein
MAKSKYIYKYQVISTRPDYPLDKKYKSNKEIIEDLCNTPLNITNRTAIYNIIHRVGKLYKYHNIEIKNIREIIPHRIEKKIVFLNDELNSNIAHL